MTISCPNCGKPLRPGVRFCGNCGSQVQVPAGPQAQGNAATTLCPHCKSPVRSGAKFCNNCGKALDEAVQPAVSPAGMPRPAGAPPVMPPPAASVASQAPRPAEARPATSARPRRSGWLWALAGLLVVVCLLVSVGGFLYYRNPAGIFSALKRATPSATALPPPTQAIPAATTEAPAVTVELLPTDATAPLSTTPALQETVAPIQDTPVVTVTSIITAETFTQEPITLLVDDFEGPLSLNWNTWGNPRPHVKPGPQGSWLELVAEEVGAAGITSKREKQVPNAPGVVIEFEAQLDERFPQYVLIFDWDQMSYDRGPENRDPGAIHIDIRRDTMKFGTPMTAQGCERGLTGTVSHTFTLQIVEGQGVDLYLDGDGLPICRVTDMGQEVVPGRISFTGLGWVTRVLVTDQAK